MLTYKIEIKTHTLSKQVKVSLKKIQNATKTNSLLYQILCCRFRIWAKKFNVPEEGHC